MVLDSNYCTCIVIFVISYILSKESPGCNSKLIFFNYIYRIASLKTFFKGDSLSRDGEDGFRYSTESMQYTGSYGSFYGLFQLRL